MSESHFEGVKKAAESVLGRKIDMKASDTLLGDLGMESIDVVDFVFEIERTFGVEIVMKSLVDMSIREGGRRFVDLSIQDVLNYLNQK